MRTPEDGPRPPITPSAAPAQPTIDSLTDDALLDALRQGAESANEAGISSQVLTALVGARNGNAGTLVAVPHLRGRLEAKDARIAAQDEEIATLKAELATLKDTAAVVAVADEIANKKNGAASVKAV